MKLKRIYPNEKGELIFPPESYGKDKDGMWFVRPPGAHTGGIPNHTVVEHEDETITVSPSILLTDGNITVHGFLEHGIWRDC